MNGQGYNGWSSKYNITLPKVPYDKKHKMPSVPYFMDSNMFSSSL